MNVILRIPDKLAACLGASGPELERQALESLVLEGYRSGRLTTDDMREVLGFAVLDQVDGFLKAHGLFEPLCLADIEGDLRTLAKLGV